MGINEMKNAQLRQMLNEPGLIVAPCVHDALCAKIAQKVGFKAIYMGGNCTAGTIMGQPDIGIISGAEMINRARYLAHAVDIPLIADADTGYGDLNNLWYTIREYEAAGVSAVHLEDQVMPKKCGAMPGIVLCSPEEMCEKIKIAQKAKRDPNFIVIARTDSFKILGAEGAIARGKLFAEAGADMVFFAGVRTGEDMTMLAHSVDVPAYSDIIEMQEDYAHSDAEMESYGCKMVCHNMTSVLLEAQYMYNYYDHYRKTGSTRKYWDKLMPIREYEKLMDIEHAQNIRSYLVD